MSIHTKSSSRNRPSHSLREERVEESLKLLRARGGRATTARRILLRCLFSESDHRTADEIAVEVRSEAPDVNISTIYRNLAELERLGIIVHVHLGHGKATYQLASEMHGHLVCEICGDVFEAPEEYFEGLSGAAAEDLGFTIDPRHFAVIGRCAKC
jgi:Fur family ferric uptake transcriptional regulator